MLRRGTLLVHLYLHKYHRGVGIPHRGIGSGDLDTALKRGIGDRGDRVRPAQRASKEV